MSFLKELEKLSQPAPTLPDLEDDESQETKQALSSTKYDEDDNSGIARRRIIRALDADDEKYRGEKVSRSELFGDSSEMVGISRAGLSEDEDEEDNDEEEDSGDEDEEIEADDEEEGVDDEEDDLDDEDDSEISDSELQNALKGSDDEVGGEDSDGDLKDDDAEEDDEDEEEEEDNGKFSAKDLLKSLDNDKEMKKAQAVREQLKIWDQVLFLKIKLQAAMRVFNQLPRGKLANDLLASADEETKQNYNLARSNVQRLITMLLEAETLLLESSPQTKGIMEGKEGMDSDDEEIESSEDEKDDDEKSGDEDGGEDEEDLGSGEDEDDKENKKEVISWKKVEKMLENNEEKFSKYRTRTIDKWDERTRLVVPRNVKDARKDFSSFQKGSVSEQINSLLKDKARQLKRFHTKRSDVERIGGDPHAEEDVEIFDDDDFYQVLLKELIEKKSNNSDDPVAMTRHYIEMQKLKNKRAKKREFDRTLSKDRKIKYVPIPKLVNFHPARPEIVDWTHEARNELFKSLFK